MHTHLARRAILALAAFSLLGSACGTSTAPDDDSRLAVVFTADDGRELVVGSYDAETGELSFVDRAQDDMRARIADAGYTASVEEAEIDLDAGIALVSPDLEDGDALELRVARPGARTLTIGDLVLEDAETFRAIEGSWKLGNKIWQDDWLAPI